MENEHTPIRLRTLVPVALIVVAAAAWATWRLWPPKAASLLHSVAIVECRSYSELRVEGRTVLFFNGIDSNLCLTRASLLKAAATDTAYVTATWVNRWSLWPSCEGRLVTVIPGRTGLGDHPLDTVLSHTLAAEQARLKRLKSERGELAYYLRVHGVQDPGYQSVAEVAARRDSTIATTERLVAILQRLTADSTSKRRPQVAEKCHFIAHFRGEGDTLRSVECRCMAGNDARQVALLQTVGAHTPKGTTAINVLPWNHYAEGEVRAVAFSGLGFAAFADTTAAAAITTCHADTTGRHDLPLLLGTDGTPIFSKNGHFIGISNQQQIVRRRTLRKLLRKGGQP